MERNADSERVEIMATIIDELIFDRTQADVDRVRELKQKYLAGTITETERTEFLEGLKGAYNAKDLNRVGNAVAYIAALLRNFGIRVSVNPRTDWSADKVPAQSDASRYIADIAAIKTATGVSTSLPQTLNNLTFESANNIEQILYEAGKKYADSEEAIPRLSFICGRPSIGNRG